MKHFTLDSLQNENSQGANLSKNEVWEACMSAWALGNY